MKMIKKITSLIAILTMLAACAHKSYMPNCPCDGSQTKCSTAENQQCKQHTHSTMTKATTGEQKSGSEKKCDDCRGGDR